MIESPGNSNEQRAAEKILLDLFAKKHGVLLTSRTIPLHERCRLELDGFCESPPIICEVWSHIDSPKQAQRSKVMKDALKLDYARRLLKNGTRCFLVFADNEAASPFIEKSWMSDCLKEYDISVEILDLPTEHRNSVIKAQARQYR
jgi:hypothetical protein